MNTIYEDDTGSLNLEIHNNRPFIHCDINKWGKKEYKHCLDVWEELLFQLYEKGFNYLYAPIDYRDSKLQNFASMFGMYRTTENVLCFDGKIREVWRIECHKQRH